MENREKDARFKFSAYGNGTAIIEILNIGFEPLLTQKEYKIYQEISSLKQKLRKYTHIISFIKAKLGYLEDTECYCIWLKEKLEKSTLQKEFYEEKQKYKEELFKSLLSLNIHKTRKIYETRTFKNEEQFRNIAIFESDLTRCFGCHDMEHSDDIISIVTFYTAIFESIMQNGFDYKGRHFVFFTAGAGQTRCKKSTFVSEDKLNKTSHRLFCGLSQEEINRQGGMNTNKYLAYTSLCQTNTEIWKDFNIDRAIVVDDIEYQIPNQKIRYIYTESPKDKAKLEQLKKKLSKINKELQMIKTAKKNTAKGTIRDKAEIAHEKELQDEKKNIREQIAALRSQYHKATIQTMDIAIPFTDGFGISLKKIPSSMIRLPFIKGLIAYCPRRAFTDWCKKHQIKIHKITDIYGKSYSISEVDYIFTKSQFKMWRYFNNEFDQENRQIRTGWEVYRDNFKKYGCDACRCNVETNVKLNAKTNYQILQTLTTEMTDDDIYHLASYDINTLNGIGRNVQCMLNVFAIPDTLACLQWWFTDMDKKDLDAFGFIKDGFVSCNLFQDNEELDCLRSPHLDHAHCIRKNQYKESDKKWLKSNGAYIGMKDTMSKILMYDNDGDKLLLHNNKTIIQCAKQFQKKYGMIPNYYDMPKANPESINNTSLFNGIVNAYHHGNIGIPSNEITKIWMTLNPDSTKEEIEKAIEIIALRCADVNYTIDYAKTLYKPEIPEHIIKKYKEYSGKKVPHFFLYAKNKTKMQVEKLGKCNIDRIADVVKSNRIVFKDLLGKYSYKTLMSNPDVDTKNEKAMEILSLYKELEKANLRKLSHIDFSTLAIDEKKRALFQMELDTRKQRSIFSDITGESMEYITDVLVKLLHNERNKDTLWRLFGEVICQNIKKNLKGTKICSVCKKRYEVKEKDFSSIYCKECKAQIEKEHIRQRVKKHRKNKQVYIIWESEHLRFYPVC